MESVLFAFYNTSQIDTLRKHFQQFNRALELIRDESYAINRSFYCELQWQIIDHCLKGQLDEMAKELSYSHSIKNLSIKAASKEKIQSVAVPLTRLENGKFFIDDWFIIERAENSFLKKELSEKNELIVGLKYQIDYLSNIVEELNATCKSEKDTVERQEKTLEKQQKTLGEQQKTLKKQGETINIQRETVSDQVRLVSELTQLSINEKKRTAEKNMEIELRDSKLRDQDKRIADLFLCIDKQKEYIDKQKEEIDRLILNTKPSSAGPKSL